MSSLILAASTSIGSEAYSAGPLFIVGAFVVLALVIFAVRMLLSHGGKSERSRP